MERLADYIHRVTQLESEGEVSRARPNHDPVEQDAGGDRSGQRDTGGDRQDCGAHIDSRFDKLNDKIDMFIREQRSALN